MGLFDKIFGNSETTQGSDDSKISWNQLTSISQLEQLVEESQEKIIIIFKHSTRCGISRMALNGFERDFNYQEGNVKAYYLDILTHRDVSDEIALRFNVWHESPQMIILKSGKVVDHFSHGNIDAKTIDNFL